MIKSTLLKSIAAVAVATSVSHAAPSSKVADFYVSPSGKDSNPGTLDQPFRTIVAARNAVRQMKQTHKEKDILVYLRGGQYRPTETIVFNLDDGGSNSQSITYSSYPGEVAVINGSQMTSGWKRIPNSEPLPHNIEHLRDKVWVFSDPRIKSNHWKVYNLFKGDRKLPRSRQGFAFDNPFYANQTKSKAAGKFRKITQEDIENKNFYSKSRRELTSKGVKGRGEGRFEVNEMCGYLFYPKNSIKNWDNLDDIELFLFTRAEWLHEIRGIRSIDKTNRRAFFDFPTKFSTEMRRWRMTHPEKYPHEFFVENALDYMDELGEWCVNSDTGKVYLLADKKPSQIEGGYLTELIKVEGKVEGIYEGSYQPNFVDVPVKNLCFKGIHFTKGNGYRESRKNYYTHVAYDLYDSPSAMLRFRGTEHCSIEQCHFSLGGAGGVRLDLHAQHNIVKNNNIHDLGRAGITLIGYTPGIKDVNKHNTIYNNHVYRIGQTQLSSMCIGLMQSGHNHIAHNTIHDFPFMGIATLGHWTFKMARALKGEIWGEEEGFERPGFSAIHRKPELTKRGEGLYDYLHSRKNLIEYNEMYDGCYALGDINPMYINTCGGNNLIRRNFAHDCLSHSHIGTAFRTDGGSIDNIMEENIAYNCVGGIVIKSRGNRYTNNFIIADKKEAVERQGLIKLVVHQPQKVFQTRASRNIAYTTFPLRGRDSPHTTLRKWFPLLSVRLKNDNSNEALGKVEKQQDPARMNHHIFFSTQGKPAKLPTMVGPHSVFLDPQFRDIKKFDFFIQNTALLKQHKVKQIDTSKIGLTQEFPDPFRSYQISGSNKQKLRISTATKLPVKPTH